MKIGVAYLPGEDRLRLGLDTGDGTVKEIVLTRRLVIGLIHRARSKLQNRPSNQVPTPLKSPKIGQKLDLSTTKAKFFVRGVHLENTDAGYCLILYGDNGLRLNLNLNARALAKAVDLIEWSAINAGWDIAKSLERFASTVKTQNKASVH